jgi:putative tryptophan/tyrosine transport system substrate-binding protein
VSSMGRREFVAFLGGAAVAWPVAARAQQAAMPVIGFLRSTSSADSAYLVTAFRHGLKESGFVEGQNCSIEYRWADNHFDRLPALVADLLRWPVTLIVGNFNAALAAKAATTTVPIVFASGGDPVGDGLVASLNRPGGNITGINFFFGELGAKRLELLRQLVPGATTIGVVVNPYRADTEAERRDVLAAAQTIGQKLVVLDVSSEQNIEEAFAAIVQRGAGALYVGTGAFTNSHRERLVALAARHALPAAYSQREAVEAGGLMSYGTNIPEAYRLAGRRADTERREASRPACHTLHQIRANANLKTAKTLGLEVPDKLLALADEVIE